jgi:hypothetical protein
MFKKIFYLGLLFFFFNCANMQAQNNIGANDSLLVALMKQNPNNYASLLADPEQYRILKTIAIV